MVIIFPFEINMAKVNLPQHTGWHISLNTALGGMLLRVADLHCRGQLLGLLTSIFGK